MMAMEIVTESGTEKIILPFERTDEIYEVEKISQLPSKHIYGFIKRTVDIIASLAGIIILLIPMLIAYICVAATSKGNPIYRQERLGYGGKRFYIYKFRTMCENAEEDGIRWSIGEDDERLTAVGRVLRRIKFDEIPQLFNCLRGDLSLVGPRPEREVFYKCFETYIPGFSQRLMVKPGITGLAQITGLFLRPEEKIKYDIEYIKKRSLLLDTKILLLTAAVVIRGDGQNKSKQG